MREAIEPDENNYYQAIIWVAAQRPSYFDICQQQSGWIGVRWFYATLDTIPDIVDCATALIVLAEPNDDELMRAPDILHALETRGTMVGAVIVLNPHSAFALHRAWREQISAFATAPEQQPTMPLIVAVDTHDDANALLMLLNQFTYAAMLVCVDWFDVRVVSAEWGQPCSYHRISADNFDSALAIFSDRLKKDSTVPFSILIEDDLNLEHFSALSDYVDLAESFSSIVTTLMLENDECSPVQIHWLTLFSEDCC